MNARLFRAAGAALLVLLGIWAGARMYASHTTPPRPPVPTPAPTPAGAPTPTTGAATAPAAARAPAVSVQQVPAGESSPASPVDDLAEGAAPAIPDRLPDFSLADLKGSSTPISHWRGKSLIINFWATWCAPCRREMPLLQALDHEWRGRGVQVIGIAVDHSDKVAAFADALKITYPLLVGEGDALDAARAFGVVEPAFPFTVFTDRRAEVVALYVGELHKPQTDLILSAVEALDQNRVKLADARRTINEGLGALSAVR